jgi:hypothetical protein
MVIREDTWTKGKAKATRDFLANSIEYQNYIQDVKYQYMKCGGTRSNPNCRLGSHWQKDQLGCTFETHKCIGKSNNADMIKSKNILKKATKKATQNVIHKLKKNRGKITKTPHGAWHSVR